MTEEKLSQAKGLEKEISKLKEHYSYVKTTNVNIYEGIEATIFVSPTNASNKRDLINAFLPISVPEFVEMYLNKVEKQIKKLEKEFEKL